MVDGDVHRRVDVTGRVGDDLVLDADPPGEDDLLRGARLSLPHCPKGAFT
jgi:hypothetical protein